MDLSRTRTGPVTCGHRSPSPAAPPAPSSSPPGSAASSPPSSCRSAAPGRPAAWTPHCSGNTQRRHTSAPPDLPPTGSGSGFLTWTPRLASWPRPPAPPSASRPPAPASPPQRSFCCSPSAHPDLSLLRAAATDAHCTNQIYICRKGKSGIIFYSTS